MVPGVKPTWPGCRACPLAADKSSAYQTHHPKVYDHGSQLQQQHPGLLAACHSFSLLKPSTLPLKPTLGLLRFSIYHFYFQLAPSSSPIVWRSLDCLKNALSFKKSTLFLESSQRVHILLPTGVLSLSISSSVLLLKSKELKCHKMIATGSWPLLLGAHAAVSKPCWGSWDSWHPPWLCPAFYVLYTYKVSFNKGSCF